MGLEYDLQCKMSKIALIQTIDPRMRADCSFISNSARLNIELAHTNRN